MPILKSFFFVVIVFYYPFARVVHTFTDTVLIKYMIAKRFLPPLVVFSLSGRVSFEAQKFSFWGLVYFLFAVCVSWNSYL